MSQRPLGRRHRRRRRARLPHAPRTRSAVLRTQARHPRQRTAPRAVSSL